MILPPSLAIGSLLADALRPYNREEGRTAVYAYSPDGTTTNLVLTFAILPSETDVLSLSPSDSEIPPPTPLPVRLHLTLDGPTPTFTLEDISDPATPRILSSGPIPTAPRTPLPKESTPCPPPPPPRLPDAPSPSPSSSPTSSPS